MPRETSALTEQLASMCSEHTSRNRSLRQMCSHAKDHPQGFAPDVPEWTIEERANWYLGFMEAMQLVLNYIDSASPTPRAEVQRTHR